jgi:hypothetical protein
MKILFLITQPLYLILSPNGQWLECGLEAFSGKQALLQ